MADNVITITLQPGFDQGLSIHSPKHFLKAMKSFIIDLMQCGAIPMALQYSMCPEGHEKD